MLSEVLRQFYDEHGLSDEVFCKTIFVLSFRDSLLLVSMGGQNNPSPLMFLLVFSFV